MYRPVSQLTTDENRYTAVRRTHSIQLRPASTEETMGKKTNDRPPLLPELRCRPWSLGTVPRRLLQLSFDYDCLPFSCHRTTW